MTHAPAPTATILIIEDNPANLKVASDYLQEHAFAVLTARNGAAGLARAALAQPDLILLDVQMPGIDGFETCRRLKADSVTADIPIIFMTALSETDYKVRGLEAGAVDYITKPLDVAELLARVNTHLRIRILQRQLQEKNDLLSAANAAVAALNAKMHKMFNQFATKEVADQLLTQGFSTGGALVQATAMFSDIRGFTSLTESQPPDAVIELLNEYFEYMIATIGSEGGIVNQMVGDGLMAIFGAPIKHADHAQRAVRAALKMIAQVAVLNQRRATEGKHPIAIGIGIASGPVIAGFLGTQHRATYTCVGDTVNVAARLEAHTKTLGHPILIDGQTQAALPPEMQVTDHGWIELKGKIQQVHVYAVPVETHT